jgi:predicted metal-dependent phosphoesterase TrpH
VKADLHIHTRVSDGLASVEQTLAYAEHRTDLDAIAITDHEDVNGGLRGRELAARRGYRLEVVPGAEVTTLQGHLVALFIERTPKSFRPIERTLEDIHAQGGVAIVPHPNSRFTRSISRRTLERICQRNEQGVTFDGIDLVQPSALNRRGADSVAERNRDAWRVPVTAASDAHYLGHLGTGWVEWDEAGMEGLRRALLTGTTRPGMSEYPPLREIGFGKLALGLAWGYTATPRKVLGLR